MNTPQSNPFILTLKLDQHSFTAFNKLRQLYFPAERNYIPAHITLFHNLPPTEEQSLVYTLEMVSSQTTVFELSFPDLRFLGGGVAINVRSKDLLAVRKELASRWEPWLTAQDQAGYRPHITLQNKVSAREARQLYEDLQKIWQPRSGTGEGLLLWTYLGGPWALHRTFPFH